MQRPIKYYGDPILRQTGRLITAFDAELKALADDMIETMYAEAGLVLPLNKLASINKSASWMSGLHRA